MDVISTERLILRHMEAGDAAFILALLTMQISFALSATKAFGISKARWDTFRLHVMRPLSGTE